jgi:hypothetical protein
VSLSANRSVPRHIGAQFPLRIVLSLLFCVSSGFTQNSSHASPKYDLQTESKTKGIVDEVKLFDLGTRKDFVELIVKTGEDKIVVYVCPKSFQDELGVTLSKGDEITVTGSKVKQESSDVILARQVERGTDTLLFRDNKGNPVWDWRTGK